MSDKKKQIEELAHVIRDGCTECKRTTCHELCVAQMIYNAGYRKLEEHEWEEVAIVKSGEIVKRCYECPVCSALCDTNEPLCPACGAKMNGGGGDDR